MALRDFCVRYGSAPVKLVCWEEERQQGIRQILESLTGQSPIVLLIGPEGGLTVHEIEMARTEGFTTASLGSHLLRTETAAIVLTGIVRYSLGDLNPRETALRRVHVKVLVVGSGDGSMRWPGNLPRVPISQSFTAPR